MIKQLLFAALLVGLCRAQDTRPRLELEPDINLNGGGFQIISGSLQGGLGMEETHAEFHFYGRYDAARKSEDTPTQANSNPHGNVRTLGGSVFGRTSGGWLFGASGGYS